MPGMGTVFCLSSGAAFGAMGVFGKLAYGEGATVGTLLAVRFTLAAALFWAAGAAARTVRSRRTRAEAAGEEGPREAAAPPATRRRCPCGGPRRRRPRGATHAPATARDPRVPSPPARPTRDSPRATSSSASPSGRAATRCRRAATSRRSSASTRRCSSLLIYTFPAVVAAAAIALGRERADSRRLGALIVASGGLALLVAGGAGALDPLGAALGLTAALTYSAYILVSEGIAQRVRPQVLAALVCTGAAVALTVGSAVLGDLRLGELTAAGWGWLAALAAISTVGAIGLFFAGLARVGPTNASILATAEPLVTVLLAFLVFSETLTQVQLGGGALVLAAAATIGRMAT